MVATAKGTERFQNESRKRGIAAGHFREVDGLYLSSLGIGTYLGEANDATDELYRRALVEAVKLGANVIDSAINYRHQRSERAIGRALQDLAREGVSRDQLFVCTKGGYIPFDAEPPSSAQAYLKERFFDPGVLRPEDVVSGHAMSPSFLKDQIEKSLDNLGIDAIDVYYLHNPEAELRTLDRKAFRSRLRSAITCLEELAGEGRLAYYGAATWNGFRCSAEAREHLSLQEVVALAEEVAGSGHRFRFVQAPCSLAATEIFSEPNQTVGETQLSLCQAAEQLGVRVVCSASLAQGMLQSGLPGWLGTLFRGLQTDAQRALQFARSVPGVTVALVGMKSEDHVRENLAVAAVPPVAVEDFLKLFEVQSDENGKKL